MHINHTLSPLWLKAAVIGSIWAAFEIIIGSFLHNLHIPFSGTFLASASVFLLVGFLQLWNERGIIIRAGIICALMKSISPSAIILGPMVGIFMEALLLETAILIFGRNYFGFIIGGALAVCSTLLQKIANFLIIYGFDIVSIASAFYQYLLKQINLPLVSPMYLIVGAFAFYALLGILAASIGYRAGKKNLSGISGENGVWGINGSYSEKFSIKETTNSHNPFIALFLLISGMVLTLYLVNTNKSLWSAIAGIVFVALGFLRYKTAFRRFSKPGLWIQFLIFTVVAAISWEWATSGKLYSSEGLFIALKMNFRAIIVIFGFAAISMELRSPVVKLLLSRHGFAPVYRALSLSFAALPAIVSAMPKNGQLRKERKDFLSKIFYQAQALLAQFESKKDMNKNIFVITGLVHQGKTSYASTVAELLKASGMKVSGFLADGQFVNNQRHTFSLRDLKSGHSILLATKEKHPGWEKHGPFYFNPEALEQGNFIIKEAKEDEWVFLDEIGRFELVEKRGWFDALSDLSARYNQKQVWVVRKSYTGLLLENYPIMSDNVFDISNISAQELAGILLQKVNNP
jgi:nucleoside-triphosphatase THEP1